MSLVIDGAARPDTPRVVQLLLSQNEDTLFVVAAGNHGRDLSELPFYPARWGGGAQANVMTVASIDGSARLSSFSNWSGDHVDIAAPGCRLMSWLDAESEPVPVSGTSQAAPIVSFGATLLASIWDKSPARLRARLMYSGRLLPDATDRARVHSGTAVDLTQALLVREDVLTFTENEVRRTVIGRATAPVQGIRCEGRTSDLPYAHLRALKQDYGATVAYFRDGVVAALRRCNASVRPDFDSTPNQLEIEVTHELRSGEIVRLDQPQSLAVPVVQIVDLVRGEADDQ